MCVNLLNHIYTTTHKIKCMYQCIVTYIYNTCNIYGCMYMYCRCMYNTLLHAFNLWIIVYMCFNWLKTYLYFNNNNWTVDKGCWGCTDSINIHCSVLIGYAGSANNDINVSPKETFVSPSVSNKLLLFVPRSNRSTHTTWTAKSKTTVYYACTGSVWFCHQGWALITQYVVFFFAYIAAEGTASKI